MVRPPSRDGSVIAPRPASGDKPSFPDFTPEVLKAGSYTIHLVLDNREVRAKNDRDYIQDNLADAGVKPITRPLQVGDAIWVAHEKAGQKREIVLDYIIERKRLDDLVSSIRDGRFHEQKFRLAKSGLKHVVYIIEDFALRETDRAMQESIDTAISSTQVVNGFFVKKTGKLDDTIRYLVRMTRMLEKTYQVLSTPG
jgi:crossover junction endonuclease MUS81